MEVRQKGDIEAASVVCDFVLELLHFFRGPVDKVVARLVIVACDEYISISFAECQCLTIIQKSEYWSMIGSWNLANHLKFELFW